MAISVAEAAETTLSPTPPPPLAVLASTPVRPFVAYQTLSLTVADTWPISASPSSRARVSSTAHHPLSHDRLPYLTCIARSPSHILPPSILYTNQSLS
jgi:hypothetical protein